MPDPLFTVFTPTYNRAHTLTRVYRSLQAQTERSFEWLIVDDGSTDGTATLVAGWRAEADFPIRYLRQENAGKHAAHNRAVAEAQGALFLTLDSDDACEPHALERFRALWEAIPAGEREGYSAVTVLCRNQRGELIGDPFPQDVLDSDPAELYYRYRVRGEKWGFQRTDVLRRYPFSAESRRGYVPEGVIWNSIGRDYRTRYVNEALRIYYDDVPSLMRGRAVSREAYGLQLYYEGVLNEHLELIRHAPLGMTKAAVQFGRAALHQRQPIPEQWRRLRRPLARLLWAATLPAAALLSAADWLRERAARGNGSGPGAAPPRQAGAV